MEISHAVSEKGLISLATLTQLLSSFELETSGKSSLAPDSKVNVQPLISAQIFSSSTSVAAMPFAIAIASTSAATFTSDSVASLPTSVPVAGQSLASAESTTPASLSATFSSAKQSSAAKSTSAVPTYTSMGTPTASLIALIPPIKYAKSLTEPKVGGSKLHGSSSDMPTDKYIPFKNPGNQELSKDLLVPGLNGKLTTDYPIAPDTGVLPMDPSTSVLSLKVTPHLSRDGGKGGYLNGQKIFIFCDTGSYTTTTSTTNGNFVGFVASSVTIDVGNNAKFGKALSLQDGAAQWSDDQGRLRGFSPLTQGEHSYNLKMQGQGYRYAVWPESSIIPLNATTALLYSPIVYLEVNMQSKNFKYTYTGSTLLAITAQAPGGPRAVRLVNKLFSQDEPEWGTIAAIRSYGSSGAGGNDGRLYVFASVKAGLLVGRVEVGQITNKTSYQYWNGLSWGFKMPDLSSTSVILPGPSMDGDMFYSPYHSTFIFVYLTPYADNTFYFRYLLTDKPIIPAYVNGGSNEDYVENIVKLKWSDPQVLYKASPGPTGKYIYAGGVQAGYYDGDDITNGGKKMMLSWTAPTGGDPSSLASEYMFVTAEITWQ
ncbi:MAG: hypothetical protein M1814_005636 [Vezdaea aestivalis]|nr:MAG: hypothetical protein M1814_005636 [Vezdaea aestivalis]